MSYSYTNEIDEDQRFLKMTEDQHETHVRKTYFNRRMRLNFHIDGELFNARPKDSEEFESELLTYLASEEFKTQEFEEKAEYGSTELKAVSLSYLAYMRLRAACEAKGTSTGRIITGFLERNQK